MAIFDELDAQPPTPPQPQPTALTTLAPQAPSPADSGAAALSPDLVGDIPPPPIPPPPAGSGAGMSPYFGSGATAAPSGFGGGGGMPMTRFGPGTPIVGGVGDEGGGVGLGAPDDVAELLRQLAANRQQVR